MAMDLHMHSDYSDGKNTPEEMIKTAADLGYTAAAITDHVWKTSEWVPAYARRLEELKKEYEHRIRVFSGIEAKILNLRGELDAAPSFDGQVDFILGSIHRIPNDAGFYSRSASPLPARKRIIGHWLEAFHNLLTNPRVDIIAHPLSELKGFGITTRELPIDEICRSMADSGKIIEFNVRYNHPLDPVMSFCFKNRLPMSVSSDSHSTTDLRRHSAAVNSLSGGVCELFDPIDYLNKKTAR